MGNEDIRELLANEMKGQLPIYIIYIDDEPDLLEAFQDILQEYGIGQDIIRLITTTSPLKAVEEIQSRSFDMALVVADLRMPEMSGFEFRKLILPLAPSVPFAVLSGYIDKDIALKGIDLKVNAFLNKPLGQEELRKLIKESVLPRIQAIKEERELRSGFVSETELLIDEAGQLLDQMEVEPQEALDTLMRFFGIIHTIKGASSYFEPKTMHRFVHHYEDRIKSITHQNRKNNINNNDIKLLRKGLDITSDLLAEFREHKFSERGAEVWIDLLIKAEAHSNEVDQDADQQGKEGAGGGLSSVGSRVPSQAPAPGAGAQAAAANAAGVSGSSSRSDLRVPVSLLDDLSHLSGEVTVIRNMLNKTVTSIEAKFRQDRDVHLLGDLLHELHDLNSSVQTKVTDIRKVSLKTVFRPLPRAVRDLSHTLRKDVRLHLEGEELRVDTSLADVLNSTLLHLVKNGLDHGLELPDVRISAGKPRQGTVKISSAIKDENLMVYIEDDGRGINCEIIKKKAIENKLHTAEELAMMTEEEICQLIFAPGFSTAAEVTDISGRGVGMSSVRDTVESVGGSIKIRSKVGQGTTFQLILPLPKSVLVLSTLFVRFHGARFGLLQDDVARVLQWDPEAARRGIRSVEGARFILVDDRLIPLLSFSDLIGEKNCPSEELSTNINLVIMSSDPKTRLGREVAFQVDEILDVEDAVLRPLNRMVNPKGLFQGATLLDDATVGLILKTAGIFELAQLNSPILPAAKLRAAAKSNSGMGMSNGEGSSLSQANGTSADAIVFRWPPGSIFSEQLCAFDSSSILRIEKLSLKKLVHSGKRRLMPYRDGLLEVRMMPHTSSAASSISTGGDNSDMSYVLVLQLSPQEKPWGLVVDDIYDLVELQDFDNSLKQPDAGVLGHFSHRGQLITMLDPDHLLHKKLSAA